MVNVTWVDARRYAESIPGGRLLSSDEWEFAARGVERRKYPWGEDQPDATRANYNQTGIGTPTPVGLSVLGATPEGLVDMGGNVWEWTSTSHGGGKETRGGSFLLEDGFLRCSSRFWNVRANRDRFQGFRCARE